MGAIMKIRLALTIIVTKLAIKACRIIKRGGTTLPGKIARKLYPDIVNVIAKDFKTIMVTGTNGKTTTSRIIEQILKENGISYIANKSGANLVGGVITTFINAVDILGRSKAKTALIEIDEAAFKVMSNYLEPDILVVTNFFRDQLDRYGELYSTLNGVAKGIKRANKTKLILNADDSLCASLGKDTDKNVIYFGFSSESYKEIDEAVNSDAMFCIFCKSKYEYLYRVYGHLGGFRCPNCGYERPEPKVTCTKVNELTSAFSSIEFSVDNASDHEQIRENAPDTVDKIDSLSDISIKSVSYEARINLPGLYNVYNSLAAVALGHLLELPIENSIKALGSFECGFGRMETINANGKIIKLILVKNPTGFNQVLNYLLTDEQNIQIAFLINDNLADGTDISWLWDVDFEKLEAIQDKLVNIYTSGVRAEDMAVRLKYSGIYADKIGIIKNYSKLIESGLERTMEGHNFYILPTYTAMLDIRKVLKNKFGLKEFWK
jgi:lipid II isoglutaminyl synthase (glutamine-hydrolysing)